MVPAACTGAERALGSAPIVYSVGGQEYILPAIGDSALTASEHLGKIGAEVVALKLGGTPLAASH